MALCNCGFEAPAGCACAFADSDTIEWLKVAGQAAQRQPRFKVDPRSDNLLSITASGLYAAPPTRFATPPSAFVYRSTTMTVLTGGVANVVSYDTEVFDNDTIWASGASQQFFARTPGFYFVWACAQWQGNATGYRDLEIVFNDQLTLAGDLTYPDDTTAVTSHVSAIWPFEEDAQFRVVLRQNSGTSRTVDAGTATNPALNAAGMVFLGDIA